MNPKYKKDFIKAGQIAKEVRAFGKSLIQKGASYNEIIQKINQKIAQSKAIAAFPPQIALDQVAAHFLPKPGDDIELNNQMVKLDVGVCCNGAIGDCAVTVDLSGKNQVLIDAAEAALLAAEKIIEVDLPIQEIGRIIEETIGSFGVKPVQNLSGHGLGLYRVHTPPSIPNYYYPHAARIKPGMTFAIEPFATNGAGLIDEKGDAAIFALIKRPKEPSKLIYKMKSFGGLPFALNDLIGDQFPLELVMKEIIQLLKSGDLEGYPPLIEEGHGLVAQAENSVLVDEKGNVLITTR